jgi:hypothetical protein
MMDIEPICATIELLVSHQNFSLLGLTHAQYRSSNARCARHARARDDKLTKTASPLLRGDIMSCSAFPASVSGLS